MAQSGASKQGRRMRGFERTSALVASRVRKVGEGRGFAATRLLTHWPEVVGEEIAAVSRPVEVGYGRGAFGATLTLLTTGANAPLLEMQAERIREKVNACYGYSAISRIRITQTAATGFAEGRADFRYGTAEREPDVPVSPEIAGEAHAAVEGISDDGLRAALEKLGGRVLAAARVDKRKGSN